MHLDFLHPQRRVSVAGWLLLVLGLSALAALLSWYVLELEPRVRAGEAELRGLQNAWTARQPVTQTLSDEQLTTDWAQARAVAQQLAWPCSAWSPMEYGTNWCSTVRREITKLCWTTTVTCNSNPCSRPWCCKRTR